MVDKIRINRNKEYKELLNLYLNLTKNLNAKLKRLFKKTARIAEREYLEVGDMYYVFLEDFSDELYKILSSHYRAVITVSGERLIKQRQKQESELDKVINTYIGTVTASKVTNVTETTKNSIRKSIKRGIADGESIPTIAKDIRQNNAFKPYRATMIARTETHSAMNYGNDEISKTLGFDQPVKEWRSALDVRTRAWHRAMNGTVVARDDYFKVNTPVAGGGFTERSMLFTGDYERGGGANVINCRCFTLYYDSADEVIGATPQPDSSLVPEVPTENPIPEGISLSTGVNPTSFATRIAGSKLVIEDRKKSLKEIRTKIKSNNENFDKDRLFLGESNPANKNAGKVAGLKDYSDRELTELNVIMEELDQLADFYKISRVRGINTTDAVASMGGGVLKLNKQFFNSGIENWNVKYDLNKNMRDKLRTSDIPDRKRYYNQRLDFENLSKYKIGKSQYYKNKKGKTVDKDEVGNVYEVVDSYEIPADIEKYGDNLPSNIAQDISLARKRSNLYHEFGHNVHQSLETTTTEKLTEIKLAQFYKKAINSEKQRKLRAEGKSSLYPSVYSQTNSKEWFAENFSAYHMGRNEIVSPEWLEFYKTEILPNIK